MTSNIRRSRGYAYERSVVDRLNDTGVWAAFRLGGTTSTMPDVLAINNRHRRMIAIECKTGAGSTLYVKRDQVMRVMDWTHILGAYNNRRDAVIAFRFHGKGSKGSRKIREYFFDCIWDTDYKCDYDGVLYEMHDGTWHKCNKHEYTMPWQEQEI